ncbi:MAG: N-acetyltransferase [Bauldia sp.]
MAAPSPRNGDDPTATAKELVFLLRPERLSDRPAIDALHEEAFGPGRFARSAYRLREAGVHDRALSRVAVVGEDVVGSVMVTPVEVGERTALLLGPLAVAARASRRGIGRALVREALSAARAAGHGAVVLVGDEPYYGPLGFVRLPRGSVRMPGPVDPDRLLAAELRPGVVAGLAGTIRARRPA